MKILRVTPKHSVDEKKLTGPMGGGGVVLSAEKLHSTLKPGVP